MHNHRNPTRVNGGFGGKFSLDRKRDPHCLNPHASGARVPATSRLPTIIQGTGKSRYAGVAVNGEPNTANEMKDPFPPPDNIAATNKRSTLYANPITTPSRYRRAPPSHCRGSTTINGR